MKVTVVPSYKDNKKFAVEVNQGCQYFRLDYCDNKRNCNWMAKMLRIALAAHNAEVIERYFKFDEE